jgi:hypothetical protein
MLATLCVEAFFVFAFVLFILGCGMAVRMSGLAQNAWQHTRRWVWENTAGAPRWVLEKMAECGEQVCWDWQLGNPILYRNAFSIRDYPLCENAFLCKGTLQSSTLTRLESKQKVAKLRKLATHAATDCHIGDV